MKKNKRKFRLHLLTWVMIFSIILTIGITALCSYNVFLKKIEDNKNNDKNSVNLTEVEKIKKSEKEKKNSGIYSYSPLKNDYNNIVLDENDIYDFLSTSKSGFYIYNPQEEYKLKNICSNDYYDVYNMQQYHNKTEIYGKELKVSVDKSGNILSVDGEYVDVHTLDTSCALSEDDSYRNVEKFLKNKYQINSDNVYIQSEGKRIFFDDDNKPFVGYLFNIVNKEINLPFIAVSIDGRTGEVFNSYNLFDESTIQTELEGQAGNQTLNITEEDGEYGLIDYERRIAVVFSVDNLSVINFTDDSPPEKAAVDALANIERVYDFFIDIFNKNQLSNDDEFYLIIMDSAPDAFNNNPDSPNAAGGIRFLKFPINNPTLAQYLDVMGHEYMHGITRMNVGKEQLSSEMASINEGLSDLFGELSEDYCDDHSLNGTCNWKYGPDNSCRNIMDPKKSTGNDGEYLKNLVGYSDSIDCHAVSTIISHSAYQMTQGENALNNSQLANLYYYSIPRLHSSYGFIDFRAVVEMNAYYMNENTYGFGIYDNNNDSLKLTDEQFEKVIDSFDKVGIKRSYDYSVDTNVTITVTDIDDKPYSDYNLCVLKRNDGSTVFEGNVRSKTLNFPNLDKGLYTFVFTDLKNENLVKTVDVMVNDNNDENLSDPYSDTMIVPTTFHCPQKEVVLALDVSGSMDGTPMNETKRASINFVRTLFDINPNLKVNLVAYSTDASCRITSKDEDEIIATVNGLYSDGKTNMYDAIDISKNLFDESESENKFLVIMSDGLPNVGGDVEPLADELKSEDVTICSLGFFHSLSGDELSEGMNLMKNIASSGYYFNESEVEDITEIFRDIANQVGGIQDRYIRIACPVDVTVSYNGEVLSSAEENFNTRTSFGTLSFEDENNEVKILRLDKSADYEICITGTGRGKMNYSIGFADSNGDYKDMRTFKNIPINKKTVIVTNSEKSKNTILNIDSDGDGKFDMKKMYSENGDVEDYDRYILIRVGIISGIIFLIIIISRIVIFISDYRKSKYCPFCSAVLKKNYVYCLKCGRKIERLSLYKKQSKKSIIAKSSVTGICSIFTVVVLLIYNSSANTVFMQIQKNQFVSAKIMYKNSVSDSFISRKYLSFVTDNYLKRIESANKSGKIDDDYKNRVVDFITELNIE